MDVFISPSHSSHTPYSTPSPITINNTNGNGSVDLTELMNNNSLTTSTSHVEQNLTSPSAPDHTHKLTLVSVPVNRLKEIPAPHLSTDLMSFLNSRRPDSSSKLIQGEQKLLSIQSTKHKSKGDNTLVDNSSQKRSNPITTKRKVKWDRNARLQPSTKGATEVSLSASQVLGGHSNKVDLPVCDLDNDYCDTAMQKYDKLSRHDNSLYQDGFSKEKSKVTCTTSTNVTSEISDQNFTPHVRLQAVKERKTLERNSKFSSTPTHLPACVIDQDSLKTDVNNFYVLGSATGQATAGKVLDEQANETIQKGHQLLSDVQMSSNKHFCHLCDEHQKNDILTLSAEREIEDKVAVYLTSQSEKILSCTETKKKPNSSSINKKTFSCSAGNATFDRLMGHRPVGVTDKGLLQYKYLMSACKSCNQHQKQHKESVKAQSVIKRNKEIKLSIYTSGGITLIDSEFNSNAVDCDNVSFEEEEEVVVTSENEINEEPITILKENKAQSLSLKVLPSININPTDHYIPVLTKSATKTTEYSTQGDKCSTDYYTIHQPAIKSSQQLQNTAQSYLKQQTKHWTDQESLLNVLANIEQTKDDDTLTTSSCDLSTKDEELVQVVKDELLHQLQVLLTNPSQPQLPINQEMETNQYDTSSFETDIDSSVATPLQTPVPTPPRAPTPTQSRADLATPTPSTVDLIQEDDKSAVQHETPLSTTTTSCSSSTIDLSKDVVNEDTILTTPIATPTKAVSPVSTPHVSSTKQQNMARESNTINETSHHISELSSTSDSTSSTTPCTSMTDSSSNDKDISSGQYLLTNKLPVVARLPLDRSYSEGEVPVSPGNTQWNILMSKPLLQQEINTGHTLLDADLISIDTSFKQRDSTSGSHRQVVQDQSDPFTTESVTVTTDPSQFCGRALSNETLADVPSLSDSVFCQTEKNETKRKSVEKKKDIIRCLSPGETPRRFVVAVATEGGSPCLSEGELPHCLNTKKVMPMKLEEAGGHDTALTSNRTRDGIDVIDISHKSRDTESSTHKPTPNRIYVKPFEATPISEQQQSLKIKVSENVPTNRWFPDPIATTSGGPVIVSESDHDSDALSYSM